jgi:ribosome maturation factor RimP
MDKKTLKKIIEDCGVSLYDTQITSEGEQKIFRVFISHPDGINLDQCTKVTKIISPILDIDPPMSGKYTLEVSSPGIDRQLTKIENFENSINDLVKLKIQTDSDNEKIKAKILKVEDKQIFVYDKTNKEDRVINFANIIKAKTYFEW